VYVLWGSTYLAIRFALESYPPFLLGAIRMAIAGALMFAVLRWRGVKPPTKKQWRTLAVLSIFMVLLSNGLVNLAETQVGSGLGRDRRSRRCRCSPACSRCCAGAIRPGSSGSGRSSASSA
jgi:hypothetical protein